MIDRDAALAHFLPVLAEAAWVALDTEADSLHAYPEKLCLLQISVPGHDVVIDPLARLHLDPVFRALQSHRLVLHGADYDLRLLRRTFGFVPSAVFDTMLAARLLGQLEVGLDKLVGRYLGLHLDKTSQRANWAVRPLTARLLEYARNDTRHLHALELRLTRELERLGRMTWHEELCQRLVEDCAAPPVEDPDGAWRLGGSDRLSRRGLAVLRAVHTWRDQEARACNRPPYFVLPHETLLELAAAAGQGHDLAELLSPRMRPSRRTAILDRVARALALPESEWPHPRRTRSHRLTHTQRTFHHQLRSRRDREARALGLDPSLIASKAMLLSIASGQANPARDLLDWQRRLLGL